MYSRFALFGEVINQRRQLTGIPPNDYPVSIMTAKASIV